MDINTWKMQEEYILTTWQTPVSVRVLIGWLQVQVMDFFFFHLLFKHALCGQVKGFRPHGLLVYRLCLSPDTRIIYLNIKSGLSFPTIVSSSSQNYCATEDFQRSWNICMFSGYYLGICMQNFMKTWLMGIVTNSQLGGSISIPAPAGLETILPCFKYISLQLTFVIS